jgi:hypothetical protein
MPRDSYENTKSLFSIRKQFLEHNIAQWTTENDEFIDENSERALIL